MPPPQHPPDLPPPLERSPAVDVDSFAMVVRRSRERAREVVGRLGSGTLADAPPAVQGITDEWLAAVEHLQVAEEELRQQNEELAASAVEVQTEHARYQDLFELAPDAYVVTDAMGIVREANRAAAALFRVPRGSLDGKPLAVFVDAEARRVFRDCVDALSEKPRCEQVEVTVRPRYGPRAHVSITATASRGPDGKVATIRWMLRDVTERRRADERLRAVTVTIERRVGERTGRLEQMILERDARISVLEEELAAERLARLEADALAARRADLLGILSHEIRTPLHASRGYLELLELGGASLTVEQHGYLTRMEVVQDYLLSILEGVLALSRFERGYAELDLADVPVDTVLGTIPALVQPQMLGKHLRYEQRPGDRSVTVYADREKLQRIVLNLVSNAVKFTPPGGLVAVSWDATPEAVAIHVRDTGIGIHPGDQERIFEPFVQVTPLPGAGRPGVGLGLAISRQLARLMGGELSVRSAIGEGTTFTLTLPKNGPAKEPHADA